MFKPFIYGLIDPLDPGHVRYVGMAMRAQRPYHHAKVAKRSQKHSHLFHWIRLLQAEGREPTHLVLEELNKDASRNFVGLIERMYIDSLRRIGHRLTNVAEGGYGGIATRHTQEFCEKQRRRMTGRVVSEKERAETSARNIGNRSKLGQKDSPETRARKSAANKAYAARIKDTDTSSLFTSLNSEQEV